MGRRNTEGEQPSNEGQVVEGVFVFDADIEIVAPERGINLLQFEAGVPKQVPSGWEDTVRERGGKPYVV